LFLKQKEKDAENVFRNVNGLGQKWAWAPGEGALEEVPARQGSTTADHFSLHGLLRPQRPPSFVRRSKQSIGSLALLCAIILLARLKSEASVAAAQKSINYRGGKLSTMTTALTPTQAATPASIRLTIELVAGTLVLFCAIYFFRTWLTEHDARLKAEASVAAAQKSIDQASIQLRQLQDADQQRTAQTSAAIEKIKEAAAAQKTPQQITNWIPAQLRSLPAPINSSFAPATPQTPSPSATFVVPGADLDSLKDLISQGQQCAVKLPSVEAAVTSCQSQVKAVQEQLAEAEMQRDAYKLDLKGGTFWHRVGHDLKAAGIAASVGALAVCGSGHCK
jgi:hypothetical protein